MYRTKQTLDKALFTDILSNRDQVSGRTNTIRPERGVIQGDSLSPLLFGLVLEKSLKREWGFCRRDTLTHTIGKGGADANSSRKHRKHGWLW